MSLQVEKMEKNMAKLTIEVSAEDLDKAMQNAYQKAKGRISIPGFRKGKAPRKMIEQMYGKGVFLEDAANALIPEHYSNISVTFCEASGDKMVTKGTYAKMARGEMVRFMAENNIENPVDIKKFDRLGYSFRSDLSSDTEYVFERKIEQ